MNKFHFTKFIAIGAAALALLAGCDQVFSQSVGVCISAYNEYDRAIHKYWLDGENKSGCFGNPPGRESGRKFGGGGGFACGCKLTPGKEVDLEWEMVLIWEEYESGVPAKTYKRKVKIPEINGPYPRYFRVYFMRDDNPKLQWAKTTGVPTLPPSQKNEVNK